MKRPIGWNQHEQKRQVHHCECGDHAWLVMTRGFVALVSPEDANFVGQWSWSTLVLPDGKIRAVRRSNTTKKYHYMHREIMLTLGYKVVDHINANGTDNRRSNLRNCWQSQNVQNQRIQKKKESGTFKGVWFDKGRGKYQAYFNKTRHRWHLGRFSTAIEAAEAYDREAIKLFGEFARTNKSLGLL